jgi:dTMP kinase
MEEKGRYIVIEGHDGTGKSTQVEMLREYLEQRGIASEEVHEPDGVPIASELRTIIKNGNLERDPITNLLLFTAARRAIYEQKIAPTLDRGAWVLAARNWISTVAYQGYGEGLDPNLVKSVTRQFTDLHYMLPDWTVVLTLEDNEQRAERIAERGELENPDTFESKDDEFQDRVKNGYLDIAKKSSIQTIDASPSKEEVHQQIVQGLEKLF